MHEIVACADYLRDGALNDTLAVAKMWYTLQDDDPFMGNRQKRIVERMDEYHLRHRRNFLISPARQDPFADGRSQVVYMCFVVGSPNIDIGGVCIVV